MVLTGRREGTAKLWDVTTGQEIRTFQYGDNVSSVAFSPDGRMVLTGSSDGTAKLWDSGPGPWDPGAARTFLPIVSRRQD